MLTALLLHWDLTEMTNKQFLPLLAALLCTQCSPPKEEDDGKLAATLTVSRGVRDNLTIDIANDSKKIMCIFESQIKETYMNLVIKQDNKRLFSDYNANPPVHEFKSVNILEPLYVIPPGGRSFFYDLRDFHPNAGNIEVKGIIKIAECKSIFTEGPITWKLLPINASLTLSANHAAVP